MGSNTPFCIEHSKYSRAGLALNQKEKKLSLNMIKFTRNSSFFNLNLVNSSLNCVTKRFGRQLCSRSTAAQQQQKQTQKRSFATSNEGQTRNENHWENVFAAQTLPIAPEARAQFDGFKQLITIPTRWGDEDKFNVIKFSIYIYIIIAIILILLAIVSRLTCTVLTFFQSQTIR